MINKYELKHLHPHSFTLSAAVKCNLRCEYCTLDKTLNNKSEELFKNTVEALENGTYINNVKKAFERMEESPNNIYEFQIWGQEPTIILPYVTKHWAEWYKLFPNIEHTFFSTNAMNCVNQIYDFVTTVDSLATQPIKMEIQISYDGYIGTNKVRKGSADLIKDNLIKVIKKLNNVYLKYVDLTFCLHGVISHEIFNNLTTMKQIDEYFTEIDNFLLKLKETCINKKIHHTLLTLLLVNGADFTTEDGLNLTNFVRKVNILKEQKHYSYFERCDDFIFQVLGPAGEEAYRRVKNGDFNTLDEYVESRYHHDGDMKQIPTCLPIMGDFKIMYNGDVTFCQNSIHDTNLNEDDMTDSIFDQSRKHQMRNVKCNLVTGTDEEISHFLYIVSQYANGGITKAYLNETMNYLFLLAQCGQVDKAYCTDLEKLKRHAFLISFLNTCYWNLSIKTGSPTIRNIQDMRIYGNGVLDILEDAVRRAKNER